MARPKIQLDYKLIEELANIQCTQQEIANILGCSVDTLQRDETFCGIYKKGMEHGKASLRRLQWKMAEQGNPTMLIWLGRQYLGQTENKQDANQETITPTIKLVVTDNTKLEKVLYEEA